LICNRPINDMLFSKKIKLNINKPCHENWAGMTPVNNGKYCVSCAKNVIDFTLMSEKQIIDFFKENKTGVCGRLTKSQTEKVYSIQPQIQLSAQKRFLRYLISFFIGSKAFINKTTAQTDTVKGKEAFYTTAQVDSISNAAVHSPNEINEVVVSNESITNEQRDSIAIAAIVINDTVIEIQNLKWSLDTSNVNRPFIIAYPDIWREMIIVTDISGAIAPDYRYGVQYPLWFFPYSITVPYKKIIDTAEEMRLFIANHMNIFYKKRFLVGKKEMFFLPHRGEQPLTPDNSTEIPSNNDVAILPPKIELEKKKKLS